MSRCRSTHSVLPGTIAATSATSRAVTGLSGAVGAARCAEAAPAKIIAATARVLSHASIRATPPDPATCRQQNNIPAKWGASMAPARRRCAWSRRVACGIVRALVGREARMDDVRTLAVDIGGTGIKLALLDGGGN